MRFVPAARPPTDVEVGRLLAAVRRRIVRLVRRHGIVVDRSEADGDTADGLALAEPALAAIAGASVVGRVATGPRAGHLVLRLGADATRAGGQQRRAAPRPPRAAGAELLDHAAAAAEVVDEDLTARSTKRVDVES